MTYIKRIKYRLIREFHRILNLPYILIYKQISTKKNCFCPNFTHAKNISNKFNEINSTDDASLIIDIPFGGLGDHLFYSHIPRIAKQSGKYSKVFLSHSSKIRNKNHLHYIWYSNPFFDGFCEEKNPHNYNDSKISNFDTTKENILDRIMLSYGLDDGTRWHEPEIYFDVPTIPELKNKAVYDPNFISYSGGLSSLKISKYFKMKNEHLNFQFPIRGSIALPVLNFDETIKDKDFEEFCSIIISCDRLYALTTGTATLASALRKSATIFYGNNIEEYYLHSKIHNYVLL